MITEEEMVLTYVPEAEELQMSGWSWENIVKLANERDAERALELKGDIDA